LGTHHAFSLFTLTILAQEKSKISYFLQGILVGDCCHLGLHYLIWRKK